MQGHIDELVGVTGWTYDHINGMKVPQFWRALSARGRMLRPWVKLLLDVKRVEGLNDKSYDGEPSSVQKVLDVHRLRQANQEPQPTREEERFSRASAIILAPYYGPPDTQSETQPFPGMSSEEARAIIWWVNEGKCPPDVWATSLLHIWEEILAASG